MTTEGVGEGAGGRGAKEGRRRPQQQRGGQWGRRAGLSRYRDICVGQSEASGDIQAMVLEKEVDKCSFLVPFS